MPAFSLDKYIDVGNSLSWPLTTMPMSQSQTDGTVLKINKSVLLKMLQQKIIIQCYKNVDEKITDGFFHSPFHETSFKNIWSNIIKIPSDDNRHVRFEGRVFSKLN